MTTAQVVETSVTVNNNSPIQDYVNPDDQTQPTFDNNNDNHDNNKYVCMILLTMVGNLMCSPYTGSPYGFAKVIEKLTNSWNTRIVAQTTQGKDISPKISFKKGLSQGDALCPMLFIRCLNPIPWKVQAI